MTPPRFAGRLALQQRVLPAYRAGFFENLARRCDGGLDLFAGKPRPAEAIRLAESLRDVRWTQGRNVHLLSGRAYFCYQRGLTAWLTAAQPDVLVLEANPRYLASPGAAAWMESRGGKVLAWGLGAPGAGPLASSFRRRFLRRMAGVIAYSTRGAAEYAAAGVPVDRIWVAPNAVEPPLDRPPHRPAAMNRPLRIISVGRLQRRKGVDALLSASAAVRPAPEVWIVGDGPDRGRLVQIAAGRFPAAIFTGPVHGRELQALLDSADVFVLPGTGGLAVQQALARGLPVIAAQGDGSQEDMVTPDNGWLVAPGDVAALTSALQSAVDRPRALASMGRASLHLAQTRFSPAIMLDVFVRALRSVSET
ncbi:MAG TPA: glycosyltransferase [Anaerolineales bacterium]|nr:glycosyltransferase [Anaerolineales bacterium]